MQAQVYLDEELIQRAQSLISVKDYDTSLNQALTVLIQQESTRQLEKLYGNVGCEVSPVFVLPEALVKSPYLLLCTVDGSYTMK